MTSTDHVPAKLEDVARLAGVSTATASRALNGKAVGREAMVTVHAAARKLAYRPNTAARTLATRSSDAIAVLVPEPALSLSSDPYLVRVFVSITAVLQRRGKQSMLLMTGDEGTPGYVPSFVTGGQLDGVVVASQHGTALAQVLRNSATPAVFLGDPGIDGVPYVEVDNVGGGALAVAHLMSQGCREIGMVTGTMDMPPGRDRYNGFVHAMTHAGRVLRFVHGDFTERGGRRATEQLLDLAPDLDGLFVASDAMALGAADALRAAGRSVPDDVKLVSFDNSHMAEERDWTSVDNPIDRLTEAAVSLLLDGELPMKSGPLLPTELIVRGSTAT